MFKKIVFAAFTVAAMSAIAQDQTTKTTTTTTTTNGMVTDQSVRSTTWSDDDMGWRQKYDSFHMGSVDVNTLNPWEQLRIVRHVLGKEDTGDSYVLTDFFMRMPSDQEMVLVKALCANYKHACAIRDDVAMARYGTGDGSYAWLNYPPLTWSDTPGQNSWTSINMDTTASTTTTTTTTMVEGNNTFAEDIAITNDDSRPMRMVMRDRGSRPIDYDKAVSILDASLDDHERSVLSEIFHPRSSDPLDYTNAQELDACIHYIQYNAKMADYIGRYAWYNHFDHSYAEPGW